MSVSACVKPALLSLGPAAVADAEPLVQPGPHAILLAMRLAVRRAVAREIAVGLVGALRSALPSDVASWRHSALPLGFLRSLAIAGAAHS